MSRRVGSLAKREEKKRFSIRKKKESPPRLALPKGSIGEIRHSYSKNQYELRSWLKLRQLKKHKKWKKHYCTFSEATGLEWYSDESLDIRSLVSSIDIADLVGVAQHKEKGHQVISVIQRSERQVTLLKLDRPEAEELWFSHLSRAVTNEQAKSSMKASEEEEIDASSVFDTSMPQIKMAIIEHESDPTLVDYRSSLPLHTPRVRVSMLDDDTMDRESRLHLLRELLLQELIDEEEYSVRFRAAMANGVESIVMETPDDDDPEGSIVIDASSDEDSEILEEFSQFRGLFSDESMSLVKLFEVGDLVRARDKESGGFVTGRVELITSDAMYYIVIVEETKQRLLCGPNDILRVDVKERRKNEQLLAKLELRGRVLEKVIQQTGEALSLVKIVSEAEETIRDDVVVPAKHKHLTKVYLELRALMKDVAATAVELSNVHTAKRAEDKIVEAEDSFRQASEQLFEKLKTVKDMPEAAALTFEEAYRRVSSIIDSICVASEEAIDMGEPLDRAEFLSLRHSLFELLTVTKAVLDAKAGLDVGKSQASINTSDSQSIEGLLRKKLEELEDTLQQNKERMIVLQSKLL